MFTADDKRKKKSLLEEIGSDSEQGSGSDGETSSKRLVPEKDDLSDQNQDADRPDASERAKSPHKVCENFVMVLMIMEIYGYFLYLTSEKCYSKSMKFMLQQIS